MTTCVHNTVGKFTCKQLTLNKALQQALRICTTLTALVFEMTTTEKYLKCQVKTIVTKTNNKQVFMTHSLGDSIAHVVQGKLIPFRDL